MKARGPAEWEQVPCVRCGARDFQVTRQGWVGGLRDWFWNGGPWRPLTRVCRRCGATNRSGDGGRVRPAARGWWRVPVELVGILRLRRTMVPVPVSYLVAAVAGTALGVTAQLALGWPWWLVAAVV